VITHNAIIASLRLL